MRSLCFPAVIAAAAMAPTDALAERFATENFAYPSGALYNQGGWVHHGKNTNEPIQLVDGALVYSGYQDEATGLAAKLIGTDATTAHERLQKQIFTNDATPHSGAVYMSALVNVQKADVGNVYFMTLCQRGAKADAGIVDSKAGSEYVRIFAGAGSADGKFKFGISKNGASPQNKSADLDLNTTYLLVVKYEYVEGSNNDKLSLWVNPAQSAADPADAIEADASKADASATMGLQAVSLRQGSTSSTKLGPDVLIDAIRVADTYADLWEGEGGGETPKPPVTGDATITAPADIDFGYLLQYQSVSQKITVKGQGLTGPVSVNLPAGFTANTGSISAEEAEAGYELEVTFKANTSGTIAETMTLSADGAESVTVQLKAEVKGVTPYARLNFFNNLQDGDEQVYMFQGKATVSFIDTMNQIFYAQDIYGAGARFSYAYHETGCPVKVGDRISNFYALVMERQFDIVTMLMWPAEFTLIGENYTIEPTEISLSELGRDPETYINVLVKVNDVTFTNAGEEFSMQGTPVTSANATGSVRAFAGSDIIGTTIPAKAASVTGISTSAATAVITVRNQADVDAVDTPAGEASIETTHTVLIDATAYQEMGKSVEFAKVKIDYKNLTKAAPIYVTGTGRAMFAIDTEEVPAGTGSLEVTVTYTPTTKGIHKANLLIDATPTEISQTLSMSARAYDPANMPSLTIDTSALTPFTAEVGKTQAQTFTYTVKDGLDYGKICIKAPHAGQFQLSTASLLKDGTFNITVTFAPKATGTYTETIELTSDMCEPVTFTITGTATGAAPVEDVQGDTLTDESFSTTAARKLVTEDFNSCGVRNQPLSISGWTNAAVEGTRAWWAYKDINDTEDNYCAKITSYDTKATEETDATMLLLSPALDYKNADERILTFRIMGDFLSESGTGLLQVLYIDPTPNGNVTAHNTSVLDKVYMEPINGLNIPATADYNGEWTDYVIDLEGLNLADAFFIGFSYSAPRGKNFPAVYYVDDFSWGRADIPFIRSDLKFVDFLTKDMTIAPSMTFNVTGLNLNEEIAVSITGANASKFTPSVSTLPAEGGELTINFASEEIGLHEAYVKLTSAGAPDTYVALSADTNYPSGIDDIDTSDVDIEGIYTLSGIRIDSDRLAPGIYIIRYTDGRTAKKAVK